MPYSSPTFGITAPCIGDPITVPVLQGHVTTTEAALQVVTATGTKARLRPYAVVSGSSAYTVGVPVIPPFSNEILDTDNMWNVGSPTVLTINTAGTYVVSFQCSTNMINTNTSHKGEILLNGNPIATTKTGTGTAGNQPPNPITLEILAPLLVPGDTLSVRVTITGVGNDSTFPTLAASLVSFGGS